MNAISFPVAQHQWINTLIFLRIPKIASTSITNVLGERNLLQKHRGLLAQHFQASAIYRGKFDVTHCKPHEIFSTFGSSVLDFFSFAVVRNPYDRLASMWGFGRQEKLGDTFGWANNLSFKDFVYKLYESFQRGDKSIIALHQQIEWTHSESFRPTIILRMETLEKDWRNMIKQFDIPRLPDTLPHDNRSNHPFYEELFTPELKMMAREIYSRDFQLLNY